MTHDRDAIVGLLGAWALDALPDDEHAVVEAALAADPDLAVEARRLRDAVTALAAGEDHATGDGAAADPDATEAVVRAATEARPAGRDLGLAGTAPAGAADAYAETASAFSGLTDELVADLAADDWDRPVDAYPWTVHELLVHLLAVERYFAAVLGLAEPPADGAPIDDHLRLAEPLWATWRERPPEEAAAEWRAVAAEVRRHLAEGGEPRLEDRVAFHGIDASIRSVTVVRAFELWTHGDDLRRAVGWPSQPPSPAVLHTMADWSVGAWPAADALLRPDAPPWSARVVLTGAGGGTWVVDRGPAGTGDLLVVADVVDYCRMASRRLAPDALDAVVEGDRPVADALLAAAQLFSV
ncbi:MAG: maleylpyruvate isomerase family mycothiol-dependent enzyme [Acidimicrobiales bacterium]|nr:maleylpyruvate isomerase family mycothiol-dependent enzyme [Acidimicrobiales bacterium]